MRPTSSHASRGLLSSTREQHGAHIVPIDNNEDEEE